MEDKPLNGSAQDTGSGEAERKSITKAERLAERLRTHRIELELQNEELRRNQFELERARQRYVELFNFAPIGFLTLDKNAVVVEANRAAEILLAQPGEGLPGRPFQLFVDAEHRDLFLAGLQQAMASKEPNECEVRLQGADGPFWGRVHGTVQGEGEQSRCIILIQDVTEQRESRQELQQIQEDLEDRVRRRTAELSEANQRLNQEIAERVRTEVAMRLSEAKYRQLVESASSVIMRMDTAGRITFMNEFGLRFFGWSGDEIIGRHAVGAITPQEESTGRNLQSTMNDLLARPEEYESHENENMRRDGTRVWVSWTNQVISDASGRIVEILSIGNDITDRKRAEEELKKSESRHRAILEDQTELICRYLPDGRLSYVNEAYARYYGKTREELINTNFVPNIPEEDMAMIEEQIRGLSPDKPVANFEHRVIMENGEVLWQHWVHRAVFGKSGEIEEYQAVGRRITKRKRVEAELEAGRAFLRKVIDTVPSPIFVKNRDGTFAMVNSAMAELYGHQPEEMVGRTIMDLNPDLEEVQQFDEEDRTVFARARPLHIPQKTITNAQGEKRWYSNTKIPLPESDQLLGVAVDITDRVEAEQERSMIESQVRHSQKMQALGTLAGGIAHDFNNMIYAMMGFARLARKRLEEGTKVDEYVAQIESAGMRASSLVRQILTFSRQTDQEKHPVHVVPLFKEVGKMLAATLPSNIEVSVEISAEQDTVLGDPTQIHQILLNLCTNASHAMSPDGGVLTLSLSNLELDRESAHEFGAAPGRWVELGVRDTGYGIPREIMERIFDPFFTTKKPTEGTGMGLSVVHGIVKAHGGHIRVTSDAEQGTWFRVILPEHEEEEATDAGPGTDIPRGRESVMVVDDEPVIVEVIRETLQNLGYTVEAYTSPSDALRRFINDPDAFEVIIVDQNMPLMTGGELADEILTVREMPVILITGYTEGLDPEKAMERGISAVLMKPLSEERLAQTMRQVLDDAGE